MTDRDVLALISGFVFQMVLSVVTLGVKIMIQLIRG